MPRVFNFSAGPAILPEPVLEQAKEEMLDFQGTGMSVMEMSHRGPEFGQIITEAEADLREAAAIVRRVIAVIAIAVVIGAFGA